MWESRGNPFPSIPPLAVLAVALAGCASNEAFAPSSPESGEKEVARKAVPESPAEPALLTYRAPRSYQDAPVSKVMSHLAREGQVDIDYRAADLGLRVTLTCDEDVSWTDLLGQVAREARLDVDRRTPRLFVVHRPALVTAAFRNADIKEAIMEIAIQTDTNIIVAEGVVGTISLNFVDTPVTQALRTIAQTGGYALVEEDGGWKIHRVGSL